MQQSGQSRDPQCLEDRVLFAHSGSLKLSARWSTTMCTDACHAATVLKAEIDQN